MANSLTVDLKEGLPPEVAGLVQEAGVVVQGEDLLPLLGSMVASAGEFLCEWGATEDRYTAEDATAYREASRARAAIEAMAAINAQLDTETAERAVSA